MPVDVENFCVWGFKLKMLNIYFPKQLFFRILSCSISHMIQITLYWNVLTHMFVSFQKIYTFTRLFSRDFFYYVFSVGDRSKCSIWPKQKIVREAMFFCQCLKRLKKRKSLKKVKETMLFVEKNLKFNKNERESNMSLEPRALRFSLYKNCQLKVKLWWVRPRRRKKKIFL